MVKIVFIFCSFWGEACVQYKYSTRANAAETQDLKLSLNDCFDVIAVAQMTGDAWEETELHCSAAAADIHQEERRASRLKNIWMGVRDGASTFCRHDRGQGGINSSAYYLV